MVKKMRSVILGFTLLMGGCVADLVKTEPADPNVKTIGLMTGTLVDGAYKPDFERASRKACNDRPYTVLERTRHPSTLNGYELSNADFYWVVRCS